MGLPGQAVKKDHILLSNLPNSLWWRVLKDRVWGLKEMGGRRRAVVKEGGVREEQEG